VAAEMKGNASALEFVRVESRRRHATWVTILFGALCLVNLAPLVLLGLMGGFTQAAWRDPSFPPSLAVVCTASLIAVVGVIGARRGWNAIVLSLFGLFMIAWPLFVAWVLLNMLAAAL
jgi:hypothetical protein